MLTLLHFILDPKFLVGVIIGAIAAGFYAKAHTAKAFAFLQKLHDAAVAELNQLKADAAAKAAAVQKDFRSKL